MPEAKQVRCIECRVIMTPSVMSLQLERRGIVLIFEDVPCLECPSCGQQEIPGAIAEEISNLAEYFVKANQTVKDTPSLRLPRCVCAQYHSPKYSHLEKGGDTTDLMNARRQELLIISPRVSIRSAVSIICETNQDIYFKLTGSH